ncbi:MAG TPA: adenylate/guanylate cyclase domain-containing protein [Spirochaetia bacterium]|nr:adenylate/guanylate cyclase domain-containing protein [Spirochaetia bacterium]
MNLPHIDRHLDAALAKREMKVEHSINYVRMGILSAGVLLDLFTVFRERLFSLEYFLFFASVVMVGGAYLAIVHRVTLGDRHRGWVKYLTICIDYLLLFSYSIEMTAPEFAGKVNGVSIAAANVAVVIIMIMLNGLRVSRRAVVVSTAIGAAFIAVAVFRLTNDPTIRIWAAPLVIVAGAVTFWVSSNVKTIVRDLSRRERLARFLPHDLVQIVESSDMELELGGKETRVTVLFADIRNFTRFSEHRAPEEVVGILNEYFTAMSGVIHRHGGMIDKYIGDAVMAVFGAPLSKGEDARNAVAAAHEMLEELDGLNGRWAHAGREPIAIGIALHTGIAVAGNIGAPDRMDYTVIGDTVNLTARLEELNKHFQTRFLMSEDTYREVESFFEADFLGQTDIRGRDSPVRLYTLKRAAVN